MALSWQEETATAGQTTVAVNIAYLDESDIHLEVNDVEVIGFTWSSATLITLPSTTVLVAGDKISVIRRTDRAALRLLFSEGAAFTRDNLDEQNTQLLYLAQELVEGRSIDGFYGELSMNGYRITEVANPRIAQDAANKNYVDISIATVTGGVALSLKHTLRFPEEVDTAPNATSRANSLLGFDSNGAPITVYSMTDTADLSIKLQSDEEDLGATLVNTPTGTVQDRLAAADTAVAKVSSDLISYEVSTNSRLFGLTPEMFGYTSGDARPYIQAALDQAYANYQANSGSTMVVLDNFYTITLNPSSTLISGEVAAGRGGLNMYSGVTLLGSGTITLDAGVTGSSSGAMITNWLGSVSNATIKGITLDGNYGTIAGSGITAINIVDSTNLRIKDISAINHSGGGIYVRRSGTSENDYGSLGAQVIGNLVQNVKIIGIQAERPDGILIQGNSVFTSGDNSIDCEGNDSTTTGQGIGRQLSIIGNVVRDGKNGIFIESLGDSQVNNNTVLTSGIGIMYNRIHSGASNCQCLGNTIRAASSTASCGIRINNQLATLTVGNNRISGFIYGIFMAANIDRTLILPNQFSSIASTILFFDKWSGGSSMIRSRIMEQFYMGTQIGGVPYPTSPRNSPSNYPDRMASSVTYTDVYFSDLVGPGEINFTRRTGIMQYNSSWAAYAIYGAGYTTLSGNFGMVGEYLQINGLYYRIYATTTSTTTITKWDSASAAYIAGDCTTDFNSAYTVYTKRAEWGTL